MLDVQSYTICQFNFGYFFFCVTGLNKMEFQNWAKISGIFWIAIQIMQKSYQYLAFVAGNRDYFVIHNVQQSLKLFHLRYTLPCVWLSSFIKDSNEKSEKFLSNFFFFSIRFFFKLEFMLIQLKLFQINIYKMY